MDGDPRGPDLDLMMLNELALYWEAVRGMYQAFDPGIRSTSTDVYEHEIPGGQYSNLVEQARKVGVSAKEFHELTKRYKEVNDLFGNIVKVTPSSKVVGDMALLLQKHGLTGPEYLQKKPKLDYPDSVVGFFKGHLGVPHGGFPPEVRELVLGVDAPPPAGPVIQETDSFPLVRSELSGKMGREVTDEEVLSYRLYPKVFLDYVRHQEAFGDVSNLTTPVFFYGLSQGQEIETDIEPGKTLVISLKGISEPNAKGLRTVFFDLNGFPREVEVRDESLGGPARREKADPLREGHVGAPMPGRVLQLGARVGDYVAVGDKLLVTESMKMEYVITAKISGKISRVMVAQGDMVEGSDLLIEIN
jgi:pyruvate carboxylase